MRSAGGRRKARASPKAPRSAEKAERQLEKLDAELRLRTAERDEALAQQAASAEVFQVINSSAGELAPVFETILEKAHNLCGVSRGALQLYDGDKFRAVAVRGQSNAMAARLREGFSPGPNNPNRGILEGARFVHVADLAEIDDPMAQAAVKLSGTHTALFIPLRKDSSLLGQIVASRAEVRPFTESEIGILEGFAAQAVIAIENARLLEAVNSRNRDLERSLERQTATSDILGSIAASPGEAEGTLRKIAETTARLFSAAGVSIRVVEGDEFKLSVGVGRGAKQVTALYEDPATRPKPGGRNLPATVVRENRQIQLRDLDNLDREMADWPGPPVARAAGIRTMIGTPLRSGGCAIGAMTVYRDELRPFDPVELQLLQSFADQAVIAIENARLLTEQREALERQTATAEVLRVINASPGHLTPVFEAMLEKATRRCEARFGILWLYEGERFRAGAVHAVPAALAEFCRAPVATDAGASLLGIARGGGFVHVADCAVSALYKAGNPVRRAAVDLGGARTLLSVPLRKDDTLLGAFTIYRQEVKPFSDKQIALVQNFAAQAVIAMENARLLGELRQRTRDLEESLEYQTATSDVLKVISRSTFDLQPVLETLARTAARLCSAEMALISLREGDAYRAGASVGFSSEFAAFIGSHPLQVDRGTVVGRVALDKRIVHIADVATDPEYRLSEAVTLTRQHTSLGVPLLREDQVIGVIVLARQRVETFTPKQIDLVATFADQAVIAIENTRLLTEQREALEQQTATAEVLQVINSSPGDLAPVFTAVLDKATRLCDFAFSILWTYDGKAFRAVAMHGVPPAYAAYLAGREIVPPPNTEGAFWQFIDGRDFIHIHDVAATPLDQLTPRARGAVEMGGARSNMLVALRKDQQLLGAIEAYRTEVRPFSEKQVALLRSFAAQAVIAMENARLLGELRQRTRDLEESLEYQTATSDVLKVISRSTFDLEPVLATVANTAARLCQAEMAWVSRRAGDKYRFVLAVGTTPENTATAVHFQKTFLDTRSFGVGRETMTGRVLLEGRALQIADLAADSEYKFPEAITVAKTRTMLGVPLLREGEPIGTLTLGRQRVEPFTERQIELVSTFADQAVIAIENTRLLTEQREALEQQTATAEVLQVINASPGELAPVFDAMLEKALELCGAAFGLLWTYEGGQMHAAALRGVPPAYAEFVSRGPHPIGATNAHGRLLRGEPVVHIADAGEDLAYQSEDPLRRATVELGGSRTLLAVPLRKDAAVLGAFVIYRQEVKPFGDRQITLLQNFAAQAVIAIENARLMTETREALEQQTATAEVLQVINSSPGNLAPVFDAMLEKAMRLCEATFGGLWVFEGDRYVAAAHRGVPTAYAEYLRQTTIVPGPGTAPYRFLHGERAIIQNIDLAAEEPYRAGDPQRLALVDLGGARTALQIPLVRDDVLRGIITIYRQEVRPFSDTQIALLESFATQAVIAMENARLITETRDALEQQTATAEVLQVINSSPGDLTPVFDAMLEKAMRLCQAAFGILLTHDGTRFHNAATRGVPAAYSDYYEKNPPTWGPGSGPARVLAEKRVLHIVDAMDTDLYRAGDRDRHVIVDVAGARTLLLVPLLKDDVVRGIITIYRQEVRPFSEKQIALLESFATQAVIAMENARLLEEIRHRNDQLAEALEFQTASGEVLRIVASSPEHLQSVFDAMLEKATELCGAKFGTLFLYDGTVFTVAAERNLPPAYAQVVRGQSFSPETNSGFRRLIESKAPFHVRELSGDPTYAEREPLRTAAIELGGVRSLLVLPLLKKGELIGNFSVYREEAGGFAENQIALVTTFADQAVIAIENARLFRELRERQAELARSVDELTATGDVLKIISRSSVELETVLDTLVETVARLCHADLSYMFRRRDDKYHLVTACGLSAEQKKFIDTHPFAADRGSLSGRVELERRPVHIPDVLADPDYTYPGQRAIGYRTLLGIPLLRQDALLGVFVVSRMHVEPFTDKEIELATTFADQAVIAIENARLFEEVKARVRDLTDSLEQQKATSEILRVISSSPTDVQPVFDTIVKSAVALCDGLIGAVAIFDGELMDAVAVHNYTPDALAALRRLYPMRPNRQQLVGRAILNRTIVHVPDVLNDPEYAPDIALAGGWRAGIAVPLMRKDLPIGAIVVMRVEAGLFSEGETELLKTFADQAVIAIENVRLFDELRDRQAELRVTFDNMGDGVAMFDAEPRLVAWNRNFQEIIDLPDAVLAQRPTYTDYIKTLADRGEFGTENIEAELARRLQDVDQEIRLERTRPDGRVIEVRRNPVPGGGFVLIYGDITERKRAEAAISTARDAAERALRELQTAQASLLHSQKMAALGQLTAGIAHEIKNPLNFVNNFAGLSNELLTELREATAPAMADLDAAKRAEVDETIEMLTGNLKKIVEHGRRADGIVKSMLAHSRGGSGDWQSADLNALVEEALNLAYHGARAQDQSFNITMERDLDRNLAPVEVVPQDVTRVFLNLIGNGFYAADKRKRAGETEFRPVLSVATRDLGDRVEIRVRDNGVGISPEHRDRLFQPFFTTKPTGEGTGLGLSISYDIITQQHGGSIAVDSELGAFTEFIVRLPRRRHVATAGRGA